MHSALLRITATIFFGLALLANINQSEHVGGLFLLSIIFGGVSLINENRVFLTIKLPW